MYKILLLIWGCLGRSEGLKLISRGRSAPLDKYTSFSDAVVTHFAIPQDVVFASVVFEASEEDLSIFGCSTRNVSVHLKFGSPPAINPDGSPFPVEFRRIPRPATHALRFETDRQPAYVNLTAPEPGTYYAAIFLSYEDPRYQKISQQGLTQSCLAYVDTSIHVRTIEKPTIVADRQSIKVLSHSNQTRNFIFMTPESSDYVIIDVRVNLTAVTLRVAARRPPTNASFMLEKHLNESLQVVLQIVPRTLYYLSLEFYSPNDSELSFMLKYVSTGSEVFVAQTLGNLTLYNISADQNQFYKQFTLARETTAESFTFSYKLEPEIGTNAAVPINVTERQFVVLKFTLQENSDLGGTLQYVLAFKPRIKRQNNQIFLEEEPKNHLVVGCLQKNQIAVPTWPRNCLSGTISTAAPIILNSTVTNSTLLVPYPESGTWYASFKLFCGTCTDCQLNCTSDGVDECQGRMTSDSEASCQSSIVFDVSSRPCYYGNCGKQGRCGMVISEGVAYSTCLCSNNYRGFDCSDDSLATPYSQVVLEFLLLILSNIFFLPVAFVAYRRGHYVATLVFGSVFLSSSFYHACDAGENLLSFCVFRLAALQFADFFTAVLAVWLTLLTIADVHLPVLQMAGSMAIAFCVTLNRYALWIFALPFLFGLLVVAVRWYLKYRKYRGKFIKRKDYLRFKLPLGGTVVVLGLIIYGLLQTHDNYKYLHSLWHVTMALGVFFVLPARGTFLTDDSTQSSITIEES